MQKPYVGKIGHVWVKNIFVWKWWFIGVPFVCTNYEYNIFSVRNTCGQCKASILRTILCGKAVWKFKTFCLQIGSTTVTHLNYVILYLHTYYYPVNAFSKQERIMFRRMRNTNAHMVGTNEYLTVFPWWKSQKNERRLNKINLQITQN